MSIEPSWIVGLATLSIFLYALCTVGRRGKNYPPGPPTLPLLGNLHQIPLKGAHFKFTEWAKVYGGIFSLKLGPGTAVVVTDRRVVREFLDKQSAISSFSPPSYVGNLITGGDHVLVMDAETMCDKKHVNVVNAEAIQMLRDTVVDPKGLMKHPKRFANSIIMSLVFGVRTPDITTSHMRRMFELMEHWSLVMELGSTPPVDFYPFLEWIPQRFLGNWISRANQVKEEMYSLYRDLVEDVIRRRDALGPRDSMMDRVLDQLDSGKLTLMKHQLYFLAGFVIEGGSDTTASGILAFLKAMTCLPEVQKKAQAEIDAVVGQDRTPQWSDYEKLPYVSQVLKESMRWRPVGGAGVPHALFADAYVDGMFLPKGSVVFFNVWGLHNDEKYIPDPGRFNPDRFAGRTLLAPEYATTADYASRDHYNYGVGRGLCPGIHLGERNLWIGIAKLLWAFDFEQDVDANGNPIRPDTNYETGYSEGFIVCTNDFPYKVAPRSKGRMETIVREFDQVKCDRFPEHL
ncbi:hypothetical protein LTS17_004072 [Exophiala oligosperma]